MLLFEVGVPPFLKGRWEKGLKITASYRAGYFPILPEVSLQKNKSVLTKDLLSMQCMWGPHLPALIIPKLSKKASFFAKFTCSFDYLCVFWDIPRRHRSLRRASSLDSTPSTSEHGGEAVDPKGALNPKQHTWVLSWWLGEGVTSPSPGHFLTTNKLVDQMACVFWL